MALPNVGEEKYDYYGLPEGTLLTRNNIGEEKYDYYGLPQGGIGSSGGSRQRTLTGMGM